MHSGAPSSSIATETLNNLSSSLRNDYYVGYQYRNGYAKQNQYNKNRIHIQTSLILLTYNFYAFYCNYA